ncbi:hypothetical protein H4582DRAFT_794261 [Lactarius indigo]|nr:hypothetical protein H4582DRAFT_794261 [Lactarius indigo]
MKAKALNGHAHSLLVLSVLDAGLRPLETSLPPHWGGIWVKHSWSIVPENWESPGHPPAGATINLHVVFKSQREGAFVDTLLWVSDTAHQKYRAHLSKELVTTLRCV